MTFTVNGITYESNEKGNRLYKTTDKTDAKGNHFKVRIGEHVFEQALDEYKAEQELLERERRQKESDKQAEDAVNGNKASNGQKKASKPRKSKDIAMTVVSGTGFEYTITAKQVEFLKLLPTSNWWEDGVDSTIWCDCIAEDIDWNPMSVGAMISTLREKGLVEVRRDMERKGKPKYMQLTVLGKEFADKLGLK